MGENTSIAVTSKQRPLSEIEVHRAERLHVKTAFLTNCIAPYFLPVLQSLNKSVARLRVFVSTPMEEERPWAPAWEGVDVTLQRSFATRHARKYREGFTKRFVRHFPYDTLPVLRQYKPDVIVSSQLGFRTAQAVAHRLLNKSCKLIIWADLSEHTEREIGAAQETVRRLLLQLADAIVVSGQSGREYIKRLGVAADRIVVAPYATELAPFAAAPEVKNPQVARRLLFSGQLIEGKGLELFLPALFEWADSHQDQSSEMWIVGDGPIRKRLEESHRPSNVTLRFFGNVPYGEVHHYYAGAGICVFPTLADTWGLVVNEALGAGLPILGSRYSQAVEALVTDGSNGWTYRPNRPEELRGAVARAMACPLPKLAEMSRNARLVVQNLTPEYSSSRFLRAIEIAMSPRRHLDGSIDE